MQNKELKFIKKGYTIEIDLHYKNYFVEANILKEGNKDSNTYDVTLRLTRSDIGELDRMNDDRYSITSKNINMTVYDFIMDKFADGFFKKYIDRYEYRQKCFDKGNTLFEKERLGD